MGFIAALGNEREPGVVVVVGIWWFWFAHKNHYFYYIEMVGSINSNNQPQVEMKCKWEQLTFIPLWTAAAGA